MKKIFLFAMAAAALTLSSCCDGLKCKHDDRKAASGNKCDSATATGCSLEEGAGIEKALGFYIEAAIKGDSRIARQAFAPAATMSYVENDRLVTVPIQALYDYYDTTPPHSASYKISSCSVADDVAMVRIESRFGQNEFSDMFTLVKDIDSWKIVSKVYHVKK